MRIIEVTSSRFRGWVLLILRDRTRSPGACIRSPMMRHVLCVVLVGVGICGCGPSAHELRERTRSILETEADRWDGGKEFTTNATDAYGNALSRKVSKKTLNHVPEIRSHGPDGLPKNSDDIVATRKKPHGETSRSK